MRACASARSPNSEKANKALKKHGRASQQATEELEALAILFMPIKLVPKQYDALVERVRDAPEPDPRSGTRHHAVVRA